MKNIDMVKRLVSRRSTLLYVALWGLGLLGLAAWVLSADFRWLALPLISMASTLVLLGIQMQSNADITQTLKSNTQRRHSALNGLAQGISAEVARLNERFALNAVEMGGQLSVVNQDLGKVIAKLEWLADQQATLSDHQRFRFAEIIDLYQDHSDRQQAFELRMRKHFAETVNKSRKSSNPDFDMTGCESESGSVAVDTPVTASCGASIDVLAEAIWPSVQNHIWMRDLYARSGAIAPRGFLASPDSMRAGAFLGRSERVLIDWGIDSLTFHLAEQRSRLGMTTVAIEADDRLADIAAQALSGRLQTVSSATFAAHEIGQELGSLIGEPACMLVTGQLDGTELARFAVVLKDIPLLESVYVTAATASGREPTLAVLAQAGFSLAAAPDGSDIQWAGLDIWRRSNQ